jgi:hypothetical protein
MTTEDELRAQLAEALEQLEESERERGELLGRLDQLERQWSSVQTCPGYVHGRARCSSTPWIWWSRIVVLPS